RDARHRRLSHGLLQGSRRKRAHAPSTVRAVKVEQVDFITIPTRDVSRAVEFYRDVLGIPESKFNGAEVEAPNVTLSFWNPEREGIEFQPNTAGFAVRVADVAEARKE